MSEAQVRTLKLRVTRGDPSSGARIEEFDVPFDPRQSLLDALLWVREHVDPSLAVRYSCHANACKECSALIDGKPDYLCCTRATAAVVELAPLKKRRWYRDLVSELD